jgi:dihydropteroate synthase
MSRLRFALATLRKSQPDAVVSVDTFRPDVARMAVEEYGAAIVNDVSEGRGGMLSHAPREDEIPPIFQMVARLRVPYVLTSVRSTMEDMLKAFARETKQLHALGVNDVILDPGFGFGKDLDQNYHILAHMERLRVLGLPLLVGVSRKSMATRLLGCEAAEALNATTALHAVALMKGAAILRAHDVKEAVEVCQIMHKLTIKSK